MGNSICRATSQTAYVRTYSPSTKEQTGPYPSTSSFPINRNVKMALLGPSFSGKSTILRRFRVLNDPYFLKHEATEFREVILYQLVHTIQSLLLQHPGQLLPEFTSQAFYLTDLGPYPQLFNEEGIFIPEIQQAILFIAPLLFHILETAIHIPDAAEYFALNLSRLLAPDFYPNETDVLHAHIKTIGLSQTSLYNEATQSLFTVIDVSGHQSERKKWAKCLEGCDIIVFVFAISDFDRRVAENPETSVVEEALELWASIINSKWIDNLNIILLLNKTDLFRRKLQTHQFRNYFPEFQGSNSFSEAAQFLSDQFCNHVHDRDRFLFTHLTQATQPDRIDGFFKDVEEVIKSNYVNTCALL